jgi:hypothetical protein
MLRRIFALLTLPSGAIVISTIATPPTTFAFAVRHVNESEPD